MTVDHELNIIRFTHEASESLKLQQNTTLYHILYNMCIHLRDFPEQVASKVLFAFFHGDLGARKKVIRRFFRTENIALGSSSQDTEEVILAFDDEKNQTLANELLYQYKVIHPDFLKIVEVPEYSNELHALAAKMGNQPVLFFRAVEQCKLVCHIEGIVTDSFSDLLSKNRTFQIYGLQRMGHNFQHRLLLRPYAKEIAFLLKAMSNVKSDENLSFPFSSWISQHEEKEMENPDFLNMPKILFHDELLKFIMNKSPFVQELPRAEEFKLCLQNAKLDLNAFIDRKEYLSLVKAIVSLQYAKESYLEAQTAFSMGKPETLFSYCDRKKTWEASQRVYNNALTEFIALLQN